MVQPDLLTAVRLQLSPHVRRSAAQPGRVLLRSAAPEPALVLTPIQDALLSRHFAAAVTVPEALVRVLSEQRCPPLNEFYELIRQAHCAGVLVSPEQAASEPAPKASTAVALPAWLVGPLATVLFLGGLVAVLWPSWKAPSGVLDILSGWFAACASLSLGNLLAAGVLAGARCRRGIHIRWTTLFPHLAVDRREAILGGSSVERAVAACRIALLAVTAGVAAWKIAGWTGPLIVALLAELAPWGRTPAAQWLRTLLGPPRLSVPTGVVFRAEGTGDAWSGLRAWWYSLRAGYVASWLACAFGWCMLLGLAFVRLLPERSAALVSRGEQLGGDPLVRALVVLSVGAAAVVAVAALLRAAFLHWLAMRRWQQPLRAGIAAGSARGALTGDRAEVLRQMPLFASLAEPDLQALVAAMQPVELARGKVLFAEDDPGDAFYVLLDGELEVTKRVENVRKPAVIGGLGPGDCLGEIALLENTARTATVRAVRLSRLLRLGSEDFNRLVVDRVGAEKIRELLQYTTFLGRLVLTAGWSTDRLLRYAQKCRSAVIPAGTVVLPRNHASQFFYLVFDGALEMRDGKSVLRKLSPGDYFGESGLLGAGDSRCDVVSLEESRCLMMYRDDFLEFFSSDYRISLRMEPRHRRMPKG